MTVTSQPSTTSWQTYFSDAASNFCCTSQAVVAVRLSVARLMGVQGAQPDPDRSCNHHVISTSDMPVGEKLSNVPVQTKLNPLSTIKTRSLMLHTLGSKPRPHGLAVLRNNHTGRTLNPTLISKWL